MLPSNPLALLIAPFLWMARLGIIMDNEAPNTDGMNAAAVQNAEIAREELGLARQEAAYARQRQATFDPKFSALIDQALKSQTTQDDRSAQQWDQYVTNFLPAETKLAQASVNYDTAARRDEAGAAARAGVEKQVAGAVDASNRGLARAGVSLSAGRSAMLNRATRLTGAKMSAGAERGARALVESTGLSLLDNATKTGRGLTSTGLQAAGLALNAGGTASGGLSTQQGTYGASMAPAAGYYGGASAATSASGNTYGQIVGVQQQQQSQGLAGLAGLGQLAGTVLGGPAGSLAGKLILG